jgi:hypothetical protein
MKEAILLNNLLHYFSLKSDTCKYNVEFSTSDGIEISLKTNNKVKYYVSIISNKGIIYVEKEIENSIFNFCLDSFKSYIGRFKTPSLVIVLEGVDEITGDIVYLKVDSINYNSDSILHALCRELDKSYKDSYVCDPYSSHIDIFPLHYEYEDSVDEDLVFSLSEGVLLEDKDLYKVSALNSSYIKGLLKCLWSLLGDMHIVIRVSKDSENYYPTIFSLYLDSSVSISELC